MHLVYLWIHGAMKDEITAIISSFSMEGWYRRVVAHLQIRGSNSQPIHQNSGGNSFAAVESATFFIPLQVPINLAQLVRSSNFWTWPLSSIAVYDTF